MTAYDDNITCLKAVEIRNLRVFSHASPAGRGQVTLPYACLVQTVVDETGTVKRIRPFCTVDIRTPQFGSGNGQQSADTGAALYRSAFGAAAASG